MRKQVHPNHNTQEDLNQLSKEELVEIISELQWSVARLKGIVGKDSKTSSKKQQSQHIIKKSEQKKPKEETELGQEKLRPGGQPGHKGKTRKGIRRVDRRELLHPELCEHWVGTHFQALHCCGMIVQFTEAETLDKSGKIFSHILKSSHYCATSFLRPECLRKKNDE